MKRNYGELLVHANTAMLEKLNENEHKPSWEEYNLNELILLLKEEYEELDYSLLFGTLADTRREAADVANYAAMIIHKCDMLIKEAQ